MDVVIISICQTFRRPSLFCVSRQICIKVGIRSVDRLQRADPRYPCIVVSEVENPANRKYRMIDGKHRVHVRENSPCATCVLLYDDVMFIQRTYRK